MVVTQKLQKDRDVTESWPSAVGLRRRPAGGILAQINSAADSPWQSGSMCHAV
ncbi:hypothetical protein ACFSQE_04905 [Vogesella fluminis]|uniref:hypothetical protein n=1 Tax=Vogesella fluminis TaxID=1069161 RepID=UPI0016737E43|nr:hypothetical protein [Vogesella fluminis]